MMNVFGTVNTVNVRLRLGNTTLPGSLCRLLTLPTSHNLENDHLLGNYDEFFWNGQYSKCRVKVGKHTLIWQFLQGCLPYQLPTIWQTFTY
jgi:hypothetical protein